MILQLSNRLLTLSATTILILLSLSLPTVFAGDVNPPTPAEETSRAEPDIGNLKFREVASGFDQPVGLAATGMPNDTRLFVAQRNGLIQSIDLAVDDPEPEPFLDIIDLVNSDFLEQGLLGITFDPNFETNPFVYVNFTHWGDGNTMIERYRVPNRYDGPAEKESRQTLLRVTQPTPEHNGGQIAFGPDGYLYIAVGDGGLILSPTDFRHAQETSTLLGSILRIDPNGDPLTGRPAQCGFVGAYTIPDDNPFVDQAGCDEIWAYGLRNPWRFSFDYDAGLIYIGDVGQHEYEEINIQSLSRGGQNYGWPCYEGFQIYFDDCGSPPANTLPVFDYHHSEGVSVTGGGIYRGDQYPALRGSYYFGDFGTGAFWKGRWTAPNTWTVTSLGNFPINFSTFGESNTHELYAAGFNGEVYQMIENDPFRIEVSGPPLAKINTVLIYTIKLNNIDPDQYTNVKLTATVSPVVDHLLGGTMTNETLSWEIDQIEGNSSEELKVYISSKFPRTVSFSQFRVVTNETGSQQFPFDETHATKVFANLSETYVPWFER